MKSEKDLDKLLATLTPILNKGEYVFCTTNDLNATVLQESIMMFREKEGLTVILPKELADKHQFQYSFVASWITLSVYSSLEAVGLTSAFSNALADAGISCNVVAGFFHDHIFINSEHSERAMIVLSGLSKQQLI